MKKYLSLLLIFILIFVSIYADPVEEENNDDSELIEEAPPSEDSENIEDSELDSVEDENSSETESSEIQNNEKFPEMYAVMDMDSSRLILSSAAGEKIDVGGMVHIMMSLIIFEKFGLDDIIKASDDFQLPEGVSIAVDQGEEFKTRDLLNSILLSSANDAAVVLAENHSNTIEAFVDVMNQKAAELGMTNTKFATVLDIALEGHYTTVADIAIMANEAMKNQDFINIVNSTNYVIEPTNKKSEARNYINQKNKFVLNDGTTMTFEEETVPIYDENVSGIKVDFWSRGTYTIVTSFSHQGMNLIAVSSGEGDESTAYAKHKNLMNTVISNFKMFTLINKGETVDTIKIEGSEEKSLNLVASETVYAVLPSNTDIDGGVEKRIEKESTENIGIDSGTKLGELSFILNSREIAKVDLLSESSVDGGAFIGGVVEAREEKTPLQIFLGAILFIFQVFLILIIWSYVIRKRRARIKRRNRKKELNNVTRIDDYRRR